MSGIIKKTVFVFMVVVVFGSNAWGGWFSFEPNVLLIDGSPVALKLEDIQKESSYIEKGDLAQAKQLIEDEKVYIIKAGKDFTRVKYDTYVENEGGIFVRVKDESGTKLWVNMLGLACEGEDGKERLVTKLDLDKGKFKPLSK